MSALRQYVDTLDVATRARGFHDVTGALIALTERAGLTEGLMTLFLQHTSASLVVQENADPDVQADLADALDRLAPRTARWRHDTEGPDDMPAHVKAALTSTSLALPVLAGRPALGTWQAVYVVEHRDHPHRRRLAVHILGV